MSKKQKIEVLEFRNAAMHRELLALRVMAKRIEAQCLREVADDEKIKMIRYIARVKRY